ncbi:type III-A CRISPR-associated RAMP protein Csm3, partial [Staphylococcus aureus]|nr:type III-A CRISPR-associated RAMP protein Csm3 [Staphylococcus aureus]
LVYNVDEDSKVEDDFENIEKAIHLLENDDLGGGGTRGNGRIQFNDINIETVVGEYDSTNLKIK